MRLQKRLPLLRKGVAVIYVLILTVSFIDFYGFMDPAILRRVISFQLGPALVTSFYGGGAALVTLIFLFLLTAFAGRIYCSFICPLGMFKDVVSRIFKHRKRAYTKAFTTWRLIFLIVTVISLAFGSLVALQLLDPFSIYSRMITDVMVPFVSVINNMSARLLEVFGVYRLSSVKISLVPWSILLATFMYITGITVLAVKTDRLYCNFICPVGTLLGLISRVALYRVSIDAKTCVSCGTCERVCKAGCMDAKTCQVDVSRCVSCFNCLNVCPEDSVGLRFLGKSVTKAACVDGEKRSLMVFLVGLLAFPKYALASIAKPRVYVKNTIPVIRKNPITPPGSLSLEHFKRSCTSCHVCVSHCPGHVIQPSFAAYGKSGFFMPSMDNHKGFCNFTCTLCGEVCPTGAISPLPLPEKQQVQMGVVRFIRENCIVITQKTECGACSEHCPTKAVSMKLEGKLRVPHVIPDICLGCGACEYACPSLPHKSIYVEGHPIHKTANKPVETDIIRPKPSDDFPF